MELVIQNLPLGEKANGLLQMCFEALCVAIARDPSSEAVLQWTETLTEAYFLQQTLFPSSSDDAYMGELIDKVQHLIEKESRVIFQIGELEGEID